jgi:hypothetical protein
MNQIVGRKISTSMIVLAACVLGLGLGLFGINYWHATKCASDRSPDEIEDMIISLKSRLLESESKVRSRPSFMFCVIRLIFLFISLRRY